jgi:hypothetical protein
LANLILNGSTSGSVTLSSPAVSGTTTLTLPTTTSTLAINGPAFSVYLSANQNISSSTATKIALNTEEFDTANCFDNATNYRFTPNVAGYYQFNGLCVNGGTAITNNWFRLYKNGTAYSSGLGGGVSTGYLGLSDLVYLNGTTDYVEFYGFITATSPTFNAGSAPTLTKVSGVLVRTA